ncbi:Isochorismatase hydrolase [Venturia nashicola]|nr:Isochorismatase hydrolase [Venturia nashicola]
MQNFFLSPAFGRKRGGGHDALDQLVKYAIPAARKAGIRIVWVNWGLTPEDVEEMPPAVSRAFGFEAIIDGNETQKVAVDKHGNPRHVGGDVLLENGNGGVVFRGLGSSCGTIMTPEAEKVDAGGLLMKDSWNAALYPPLDSIYLQGSKLPHNPDILIPKNRMSGLWASSTPLEFFLEKEGIKTLFMTGVNTDQCVGGTFMDAFSKGYDCVLLKDGAATTSPGFAQECFEYNAANTFGFACSCEEFARGVGVKGS